MGEERFPLDTPSPWEQDVDKKLKWCEALKSTGPENVRLILGSDFRHSNQRLGSPLDCVCRAKFAELVRYHHPPSAKLVRRVRQAPPPGCPRGGCAVQPMLRLSIKSAGLLSSGRDRQALASNSLDQLSPGPSLAGLLFWAGRAVQPTDCCLVTVSGLAALL